MEGFIALASFSLAYAFIVLLGLILLLNILGLPANWVVVLLVVLWKFLHPAAGALDVWFWIMFLGLAVLGEVLEMGVQVMNARRHGSSTSGTVAGMVGAIAGAIFLAPLFFGLGAFIGALAGAWLGCLVMELLRGRPGKEAFDAAFGTMMGRFLQAGHGQRHGRADGPSHLAGCHTGAAAVASCSAGAGAGRDAVEELVVLR